MRLIDAEPIERALFRRADKSLAKNPYENAKICAFRRAFELVLDAPTITSLPNDAPPNDPLTLDELREMDGEPVWMSTRRLSEWCIVHSFHSDDVIGGGIIVTRRTAEKRTYSCADYGKTWLAYRRRPEEGDGVGS